MPNIVAVTFDSSAGYTGRSSSNKHYHYLTDLTLEVGDQCVVDSPSGTTVVTVRSLNPVGGIRNASKWIVSKVNRNRYQARQQAEAELQDLCEQLQSEYERAAIIEHRRKLAKKFPTLRSILDRIEGLEATLGALRG